MFTNKMIWQIDEYMLYCQSKQLSEKTMESYEQTLHLFERWCGEEMLIENVTEITEEFIRRFQDRKINKIVTIEASGIAPAIMVGYIMQLPVVFVKKKKPKTMENMLSTVVHSFTKDRDYTVCISNNFLTPEDHILFIDDFLAYGNAAMGMVELAEQSGAVIEGMGFIIEKAFQDGGNLLREKGIRVESLAIIDNLDDCKITVR